MQPTLLVLSASASPIGDLPAGEFKDVLRAGRVRLAAWAPADGDDPKRWQPLPEDDEPAPVLVVLFIVAGDAAVRDQAARAAALAWPCAVYRIVEVHTTGLDALTCLKLPSARPTLYRLLPADRLLPLKAENDYLGVHEWNGLVRAVAAADALRQFAVLSAPALLRPGQLLSCSYFSWIDGLESWDDLEAVAVRSPAIDPQGFRLSAPDASWSSVSAYWIHWRGRGSSYELATRH